MGGFVNISFVHVKYCVRLSYDTKYNLQSMDDDENRISRFYLLHNSYRNNEYICSHCKDKQTYHLKRNKVTSLLKGLIKHIMRNIIEYINTSNEIWIS